MKMKLLFFILPTLVVAQINVKILTDPKKNSSIVDYFGYEVAIISDKEKATFHLTDDEIKEAIQAYTGVKPKDVFLHSPTPWGDLYQTYKWDQVKTVLKPTSAKILGIRTTPVLINSKEYINNSSATAVFRAEINENIEETIESSWSSTHQLSIGQELKYKFDFGFSLSGSTSISYTGSWGQSKTESKHITIGSSAGVEVTLKPGQEVIAILNANRGHLEVEIEYTASLDGDVTCNYKPPYKGHHFWGHEVNAVLTYGNRSRRYVAKEILRVGYYSDAQIIVKDRNSNKEIVSTGAVII